jgi:hypothetical protein
MLLNAEKVVFTVTPLIVNNATEEGADVELSLNPKILPVMLSSVVPVVE